MAASFALLWIVGALFTSGLWCKAFLEYRKESEAVPFWFLVLICLAVWPVLLGIHVEQERRKRK